MLYIFFVRETELPLCIAQSSNNFGHLLILVNPEAPILGDAGKLNILGIQLLFHNLLECFKDEGLGFLKVQGLWVRQQ